MEPNKSLPQITLLCITEWLKGSTVYSWNTPRHFFIQVWSKICLGCSSPTHHLAKEQNGILCTLKWQNPIQDALWQETKFGKIEGMGSMMLLARSWMADQEL